MLEMEEIRKPIAVIITQSYVLKTMIPLSFIFTLHQFAQRRLLLIKSRLAKIQLLPVLVLLNKKNEVSSLQRSQYLSDTIYHVL